MDNNLVEIKENEINEDEVEEEFQRLTSEVDKTIWGKWVLLWLDEEIVMEIYENWDIEDKAEAIKEIKELIKESE